MTAGKSKIPARTELRVYPSSSGTSVFPAWRRLRPADAKARHQVSMPPRPPAPPRLNGKGPPEQAFTIARRQPAYEGKCDCPECQPGANWLIEHVLFW